MSKRIFLSKTIYIISGGVKSMIGAFVVVGDTNNGYFFYFWGSHRR
jgi:hypothetical protein